MAAGAGGWVVTAATKVFLLLLLLLWVAALAATAAVGAQREPPHVGDLIVVADELPGSCQVGADRGVEQQAAVLGGGQQARAPRQQLEL